MINRVLYLAYYLTKTNYNTLYNTIRCCKVKGYKSMQLITDMLYSSLRYGSSFVDYFNFQFYAKSKTERAAYATMGDMYQFHKKVNRKEAIPLIDNKDQFARNYQSFCNTPFIYDNNMDGLKALKTDLKYLGGTNLVFKDPESTAGRGVYFTTIRIENDDILVNETPIDSFISTVFKNSKLIYAEKYLQQHTLIHKISPTALNTLRIITLINNDKKVDVIGAVFRISVNSNLDNYSKGNLAAEVDIDTGIVITGGIIKDSSCGVYQDIHPTTKERIKGFQIPMWEQVIDTVKEAALINTDIRSVGWDVAILDNDVILIEGNSKWNKDTWQIPAGYGKKHLIEQYL